LEISYWEALRAWWRVYWPTQLLSGAVLVVFRAWLFTYINAMRAANPLQASVPERYASVGIFLLNFFTVAICVWLFLPRVIDRPYRGFFLVTCAAPDESGPRFTMRQRNEAWFFVWWRQLAGGLITLLLAAPLNMILGTMRINASTWVGAAAGLFAIGPIVMKLLGTCMLIVQASCPNQFTFSEAASREPKPPGKWRGAASARCSMKCVPRVPRPRTRPAPWLSWCAAIR
jgi:hypothetical protein